MNGNIQEIQEFTYILEEIPFLRNKQGQKDYFLDQLKSCREDENDIS